MLDKTKNELSKFETKHWVKINDESRGTYNEGHQIRFNTSMLRSSFCYYSDSCISVKGTITVAKTAAADSNAKNANKKALLH